MCTECWQCNVYCWRKFFMSQNLKKRLFSIWWQNKNQVNFHSCHLHRTKKSDVHDFEPIEIMYLASTIHYLKSMRILKCNTLNFKLYCIRSKILHRVLKALPDVDHNSFRSRFSWCHNNNSMLQHAYPKMQNIKLRNVLSTIKKCP